MSFTKPAVRLYQFCHDFDKHNAINTCTYYFPSSVSSSSAAALQTLVEDFGLSLFIFGNELTRERHPRNSHEYLCYFKNITLNKRRRHMFNKNKILYSFFLHIYT